jgi:hypothetical protein
MDEREFRWYEGKHGGHPDACTCPVCCEKRGKKKEKERFGGKIECPMCGYLSVNWVERQKRYVCSNPECGISGQTLFELSDGKGANTGKEITKRTCQSCGAELSEDAKFCTQCSREVTLPLPSETEISTPTTQISRSSPRSETQISTARVAPQKMKGQKRILPTLLRVLFTCVVIIIIGFVLSKLVSGLKTVIPNIPADTGYSDELALNPDAESYLNQTWGGRTIDLPAEGTSRLVLNAIPGHDFYLKYSDGSYVTITNHQDAHNPTMAELKAFLKDDHTEDYPGSVPSFVCLNYAVMLHNNAEANGIRCAVVVIAGTASSEGHALDAFQTTDDGLVFVDDTGNTQGQDVDKFAEITMGQEVTEVPVFKSDSHYVQVSGPSTLGPVSIGDMWW